MSPSAVLLFSWPSRGFLKPFNMASTSRPKSSVPATHLQLWSALQMLPLGEGTRPFSTVPKGNPTHNGWPLARRKSSAMKGFEG